MGGDGELAIRELQRVMDSLTREGAKLAFAFDRDCALRVSSGDVNALPSIELGELVGSAAQQSAPRLLSERGYVECFRERERLNVHVGLVAWRLIVVALFDHRTTAGSVRHRMMRASEAIEGICERLERTSRRLVPMTEDDLQVLFADG